MDVAAILKTIAEPTRFKIVQLLLVRHHCSRSLSKTLGISESAVSQHMSILKEQGVVTGFRHGYHIHYVLSEEAVTFLRDEMDRWLELMGQIGDCHNVNPCEFLLDDGSNGCLYQSTKSEIS